MRDIFRNNDLRISGCKSEFPVCPADIAARADASEGIRQGLEDVARGRTRPASQVFQELRRAYGIDD